MVTQGLVIREGIIDLIKARRYAERNKIPFIDLRESLSFANVEQLNQNLSIAVSNAFRRPVRADINNFFRGECFGKTFVAILAHNFINDFTETTQKSPKDIMNFLTVNEAILH